jgi:hypothetical protein
MQDSRRGGSEGSRLARPHAWLSRHETGLPEPARSATIVRLMPIAWGAVDMASVMRGRQGIPLPAGEDLSGIKRWFLRRQGVLQPADEELSGIERWFFSQGVPQFVYSYSPVDNMPFLFFFLVIVVAFDLAIGSWVSVNRWFLLIAPAAFVFVGLSLGLFVKASIIDPVSCLVEELMKETEYKGKPSHLSFKDQILCLASHPIRLLILFAGVYVVGCLLILLGGDIVWSDYSVDFVVITVLLWTSARLLSPDVWEGTDGTLRERQRRLYLVVTVAIVAFSLEGSVLPDAWVVMGSIMPAPVAVPQALAALLVTATIIIQSHGLLPGSNQAGDSIDQEPSAAGELAQQRFNHFPVLPLLILVFCAETAILPYLGSIWIAATIPLAALASLHVLFRRRQEKLIPRSKSRWMRWPRTPKWLTELAIHHRVRQFIDNPRVHEFFNPSVTSLVVLYLVACPILVGVLVASDESLADAISALLLAFAINLFYLLLVASIAVFALNKVAKWASKEAWKDLRQRISNLGRGLTILALFAALALLTAETWEAMRKISMRDYWVLVGAILGLAGAFHLITSLQHVTKTAAFDSWSDVRAAAMLKVKSSQNDGTSPDPEIEKLLDTKELNSAAALNVAPEHPLGVLETINSVIVMMTYEIFFFFPVTIVAAIVFLTFGHITVPHEVAANWISGDRAKQSEIDDLKALPLFQQPWLRVGLLLTAFSILYLAVQILSDPGQRRTYFESADRAVRQRLAVRLAYCEVRARRNPPQSEDQA